MREASSDQSFWQVAPEHIWAEKWWQALLDVETASNLEAPPSLHQRLIEQFASNPFFLADRISSGRVAAIRSSSRWAFWRLIMFQHALILLQMYGGLPRQVVELVESLSLSDIDYSGMDNDCSATAHSLIAASQSVFQSILANKTGDSDPLAAYVPVLRGHLKQPGISGWLACRGSLMLVAAVAVSRFRQQKTRLETVRELRLTDVIDTQEELASLWADVLQYYEPKQIGNPQSIGDPNMVLLGVYRPYHMDLMPRNILIEAGGNFVAISDLLAEHVKDGKDLPFSWLKTTSLSTEIIRSLVDKCDGESLRKVLLELSKLRFVLTGIGRPLPTSQVHRILKLARSADDPSLLRGALVALSTSRFLHIAGTELILKMLRADTIDPGHARMIFNRRYEDSDGRDARDTKLLHDLARELLRSPKDYSLRAILSAAEYLAENTPIYLSPLLIEEEKLGLQVHP